jgi:hypothetical protein
MNLVGNIDGKQCFLVFSMVSPVFLMVTFVIVYPTIEDDEIPGKVKWKPGMKKKKSERVDATWNPKGWSYLKHLISNCSNFYRMRLFTKVLYLHR